MSLVLRLLCGTWEGACRYCVRPLAGGGAERMPKRQKPRGAAYRRGACWRTGP